MHISVCNVDIGAPDSWVGLGCATALGLCTCGHHIPTVSNGSYCITTTCMARCWCVGPHGNSCIFCLSLLSICEMLLLRCWCPTIQPPHAFWREAPHDMDHGTQRAEPRAGMANTASGMQAGRPGAAAHSLRADVACRRKKLNIVQPTPAVAGKVMFGGMPHDCNRQSSAADALHFHESSMQGRHDGGQPGPGNGFRCVCVRSLSAVYNCQQQGELLTDCMPAPTPPSLMFSYLVPRPPTARKHRLPWRHRCSHHIHKPPNHKQATDSSWLPRKGRMGCA